MDPGRNSVRGALSPAPRVAIYQLANNKRSRLIADALQQGIAACGESNVILPSTSRHGPVGDMAVFYGFDADLRRIFKEYRAAGKNVVLVDLGYWGRREGGPLAGYHKISVNDRHPTAYFQNVKHDLDRFRRFGLALGDWQKRGRYIVVAGMSAKGAEVEGYMPEQWERRTVAELKKLTDMAIVYRPKPSWPGATPILGTHFEHGINDLPRLLEDCYAVVTHHSNVAVDGLVGGVPAFCVGGVAVPMARSDLKMIGKPKVDGDREQWLADIAYCQWSVDEIRRGKPWRHLKNEGLIS